MMENRCCSLMMQRCELDEKRKILICKKFPLIYGDTETKHHYIYPLQSLKQAFKQYKELLKDYPYYGFMYDGHMGYTNPSPSTAPQDSFENIVGILKDVSIDDKLKVVYGDFVIFADTPKGKIYKQLHDTCSPFGVSVVLEIDSQFVETITRDEAKQRGYRTLDMLYANLIKLDKVKDSEYITVAPVKKIERIDLVNEPAFETHSCSRVAANSNSLLLKFSLKRPNIKTVINLNTSDISKNVLTIVNSNRYSFDTKELLIKITKLFEDNKFQKLYQMLTSDKYSEIYNSYKNGIEKSEYFNQYRKQLEELLKLYKAKVMEILELLDSSNLSELDVEALKVRLAKELNELNSSVSRQELLKEADFISNLSNLKAVLEYIASEGKNIENKALFNSLALKFSKIKRLLKSL